MPSTVAGIGPKRVGPFCGVVFDQVIAFDTEDPARQARQETRADEQVGDLGTEAGGDPGVQEEGRGAQGNSQEEAGQEEAGQEEAKRGEDAQEALSQAPRFASNSRGSETESRRIPGSSGRCGGESLRRFRVVTYQAYNACGLIGTEHNGVAILDEDNAQVLCDDIARVNSGWYGVTPEQVAAAERICQMTWEEFRNNVNGNPRARCEI